MSEYPQDLRYLDTHEYVRLDGEIATIGISEYAIEQLGEIVFLEVSEIGDAISKGERFGTIESVKAVEEVNAPISGTVIERNDSVIDDPELISDDPYGEGWFIKVRVDDLGEIDDTLTFDEYRALVEGE
ncbi:glycine cleavage system protein GcvH [Anabaena azotica]|uniref:glycine cleavage system protein GcvH n=1 Tax=Anabaena azotica TaxID=197653 RepID=UPI0039A5CDA3